MKNEITVLTEKQLEIACPMAGQLPEIAKENGLDGFFIQYEEGILGAGNTGNKDGIYFVIFRDEDCKFEFQRMMIDPSKKDEIKELIANIDEEGDTLNTKYCLRPMNELTRENTFMNYNRCVRAIHDLSAVKYAYGECGFRPPEYVAIETIYAINNFLDKRFAPNIPEDLKRVQEEGMKKFIRNSVKRYEKNKPVRFRTLRPHMVRQDYFIKNGISCVNCGYSEKFLKYLKTRWDECPDFVMYQEKTPYEVYSDKSKLSKSVLDKFPELATFWSDLKGYRMYRVSYPAAFEEQMHSWMFDYMAKERENWEFVVPLEQLDKNYELRMIEIDDGDIHNWISLCEYNKVNCAINHGEMGEVKDTRTFSFIYSAKDQAMVSAIQNRLSRELSEFRPTPEELQRFGEEGIRKLNEKDRAYAAKMAKKRERRLFCRKSTLEQEKPVERPLASSEKVHPESNIIMEDFVKSKAEAERRGFADDKEDYFREGPWKKNGYERGSGDYDF